MLTPNDAAAPTTYSVSRLDMAPDVSKVGPQPDSIADDAVRAMNPVPGEYRIAGASARGRSG